MRRPGWNHQCVLNYKGAEIQASVVPGSRTIVSSACNRHANRTRRILSCSAARGVLLSLPGVFQAEYGNPLILRYRDCRKGTTPCRIWSLRWKDGTLGRPLNTIKQFGNSNACHIRGGLRCSERSRELWSHLARDISREARWQSALENLRMAKRGDCRQLLPA